MYAYTVKVISSCWDSLWGDCDVNDLLQCNGGQPKQSNNGGTVSVANDSCCAQSYEKQDDYKIIN